jgi:hypothetical protein
MRFTLRAEFVSVTVMGFARDRSDIDTAVSILSRSCIIYINICIYIYNIYVYITHVINMTTWNREAR